MNLVHPSMYPFVAGKSKAIDNNNNNNNNSTVDNNNDAATFVNEHIQGLSLRTRVKAGLRPPPKPKKKKKNDDDDVDEQEDDGEGDDEEKKIKLAEAKQDDEQYSSSSSEDDEGRPPHISGFVGHHETLGRKYEDSMYQWMPAEFAIDANGSVDIKSW
jgi:hypothetical protein